MQPMESRAASSQILVPESGLLVPDTRLFDPFTREYIQPSGTVAPSAEPSSNPAFRISRRGFIGGVAVLGAAGMLGRFSREASAAVGTSDTLQCLESEEYRQKLRGETRESINVFLEDPDTTSLIDLGKNKAAYTREVMGVYRPGPIYQFYNPDGSMSLDGINSPDPRMTFLHLAKNSDNTAYYPNLSSIDIMKKLDDPDSNGPIWDGNLVYLGREPKLMHATMGGKNVDIIVDVMYGGGYYLVSEPGADGEQPVLKKYVLPFFNTWRAADVSQDSPMPLTVYSQGTQNPKYPFPMSDILSTSTQLPKLDGMERIAVAGIGVNYSLTVTQEMVNGGVSRGFPEQIYNPDLWNVVTQNAIDAYGYIRHEILKYSDRNGYCFWTYSPEPAPLPISDVYDLSAKRPGRLPSWKSIIRKDVVTTEDLSKILLADLLTINPRDTSSIEKAT
ncbi:MAG: twin-arginine translocation signal domain-containing protein [bacterium]|nr:twin-arginine translocation signal domain-containing protein [bacterium]